MAVTVEELSPEWETGYEEFLYRGTDALLYASIKYRNLLLRIAGGEARYLIARSGTRVLGVLPTFLFRNERSGNVINSLPFFGSNGGVVVDPEAPDPEGIISSLLGALRNLASSEDVVSATIVTSPFADEDLSYEGWIQPAFRERRIGQVCMLPPPGKEAENPMLAMFHPSRRRNISRAQKSGVRIQHSAEGSFLRFLARTHQANMRSIGARSKEWAFFDALSSIFEYDKDYRIYCATLEGKPIAALLVFYFNRTVEYFVPATLHEFRSNQAGPLLIFEAMRDAVRRGFSCWNFGGTAPDQTGVYQFKRRWGAKDMPYAYLGFAFQDVSHLIAMTPDEILSQYPYFYVVPFAQQETAGGSR